MVKVGWGLSVEAGDTGVEMDGYLRARELIGSRGEALTGGNKSSGAGLFFRRTLI